MADPTWTLRRIRADEAPRLRDIRLRALSDSPSAFGSTWASEVAFSAEDWERRASRGSGGSDQANFVVEDDGGRLVGLAGGFHTPEDPDEVHLVSMWVDPAHRGEGIGAALVSTVMDWAAATGGRVVTLWVTIGNDPAERLYRRLGFVPTGETAPLPSDPTLAEQKMARPVSPGFSIRAAVPADALAVAGVHVRSWQAAYRGLIPDDYLDGLRPEDRAVRYSFGDPHAAVPLTQVAVAGGAAGEDFLGFVTTAPSRDGDAPDVGEVCALYADPAAWDRGVGRALMAAGRARLAELGYREALLWVLVGNQRAVRFYERDGWKSDGAARRLEIHGIEVDEVRYRRPLP